MNVQPLVHPEAAGIAFRATEPPFQSLGCAIAQHAHHARQRQPLARAAQRNRAPHDGIPREPLRGLRGGSRECHGATHALREAGGKLERHHAAQRPAADQQRRIDPERVEQRRQHRRLIAGAEGRQRVGVGVAGARGAVAAAQQVRAQNRVLGGVDGRPFANHPLPPIAGARGTRERVYHQHDVVARRVDGAFQAIAHPHRINRVALLERDVAQRDGVILHGPRGRLRTC